MLQLQRNLCSRFAAGAYTVRSVHCTQCSLGLKGIQAEFKRLTHKDLFSRLTVKGLKGIPVNRAVPYLHGGSLEIKHTVPFNCKLEKK